MAKGLSGKEIKSVARKASNKDLLQKEMDNAGQGNSLTCRNITKSEEPNSDIPIHCPLLGFTVGVAAVVHKARIIPLWASVYYAVLQKDPKNTESVTY